MFKYSSQFQASIDEFNNIYQLPLDPDNRWIKFMIPMKIGNGAKIEVLK